MHLICQAHEKRVMVTARGTAIHRTSDKSIEKCTGQVFTIGGFKIGGNRTLARQIKSRRNRRWGTGYKAKVGK